MCLDSCNYQEHAHARVCSALTNSVFAASWHNARTYLETVYRSIQQPVPSGMKEVLTPTWNIPPIKLLHQQSPKGYWHQRADERHGNPPPRSY